MATAQSIVTRSLRLIGAIESGETPSAEDAQDALAALNDMLHGWAKEGVDLGHGTVALGDSLIMHDSFHEGIRYNLAVRLAAEWGGVLRPEIVQIARDAFAAFQAHTLEFDDDLSVDRALHPRYFTRRVGAYDIDEG